ncbi:uncharacterized protein CELE_C15F1.2 [Caenorhabditis elegans]|uniref:Uncharacterized protein n=1 Tax=Caenorhabditis elegans TaxID=6239 RepID=Q9N5X9_CAEEL|nr:Uncharacterized protein CELE_C15F1.2 [Caenorhabditis elegans]CCD64610.1 Uncharacterized protein CELE_C15F1.2 [Caenorhabditis elegans]|eukprot:NP_495433.1 Uncharacterized protein CELE_C15F1.2 [Caenorhabditis elegans]
MRIFLFFLLVLFQSIFAQYESPDPSSPAPSSNYCAAFVECAAVSLLEERLCLGNSLWRPYWLPERRDTYDCHHKLKNDYNTLERLEEELDGQLIACLNENVQPLDKKTNEQCQILGRPARFSFSRTITYVPNHCFTGVKRRIERQCGEVAKCCPSIEKCKLLSSESTLQKMINTTRTNLRKRADDCKKGMPIAPIFLDGLLFSEDESNEKTWSPTGHVNVRFTDKESNQAQRDGRKNGFVNVRFTTQQENEERARKLLIRYGDKEGDGLTLPKLSYPPQTNAKKEFDQKFNAAMKKTDSIKQRIETLDRSKIAKEGFDSLIDAATVSETINNMPPMGTVTLLQSNDDNIVVEDSGDKTSISSSIVFGSSSESVTTSPIIFVEKIALPQMNQTIEKCRVSTTIRFSNILKILGENPNSKDFKEVKGLVERFEQRLKGKELDDEQKNKAKLIEKALEMLLENFDDTDYKKVERDVEKVVNETRDLPICQETEESMNSTVVFESIDDPTSTMLVDDNGDKFIIQKGATTLIVGGEKEEDPEKKKGEEVIKNFISEEYKVEIDAFRREHNLWTKQNSNTTLIKRNETTCDMYMRCRSQMHLAVDSCAWRFASDQLLATMAESAESLLYKDDGVCSQKDGDKVIELYEYMIKRNDKLRICLDNKNEKYFEDSVCLAYPEHKRHEYDDSLRRLLNTSFEYSKSRECFHDANLIQEKCTHLRDCCPNFDECREETFEVEVERTIISLTATINEIKQECVKRKAKEAVKNVVRQLLLNTDAGQKLQEIAQLGLDISRGARVVRMAKYRA